MTNKEWLASLPAEEFYDRLQRTKHEIGRGFIDARGLMIDWLDKEHQRTLEEKVIYELTKVIEKAENDRHTYADPIHVNVLKEAVGLLKEQETVVRCKDCKWKFDTRCPMFYEGANRAPDINWYCADGERS